MTRFHLRLALISTLLTLASLAVLPSVPIYLDNQFVKLDSSIGGYKINLFNGAFSRDLGDFRKGIDFAGGRRFVFKIKFSEGEEVDRSSVLYETQNIIQKRAVSLGIKDYSISTDESDYLVLLDLPALENIENITKPLTADAQLSLRNLRKDLEWSEDKFMEYVTDPDVWEDSGINASHLVTLVILPSGSPNAQGQSVPRLQLKFTDEGREKFVEVAKENIGRPIALFVGETPFPVAVPVVSEELAAGFVGDPIISGNFNESTIKVLTVQMETGNLPYETSLVRIENIEPNLSPDHIRNNITVGLILFCAIVLFFVIRYGKIGLIGSICFSAFNIFYLALFKLVPVIVSIKSLVGFVIAFSFCVYLFILIFENIVQEIRLGKPKNLSEQIAFQRLWQVSLVTIAFTFLLSALGILLGYSEFSLSLASGIFSCVVTVFFIFRVLLDSLGWYRSVK